MPYVLVLAFFAFVPISAARIVLTLYALDLGAQPLAIGALTATFYFFPLLISWPIGSLSDRFGSRWLLTFGGAAGVCAMLVPFALRDLAAIYVAGILLGLSFAFSNVLLQNLVGLLSKPERRTRDFSNFSLIGASTNLVGPMLAGLSIDHIGHRWACAIVAAVSIVYTVLLLAKGRTLPGGRAHVASGTSVLDTLSDKAILRILAASSFVQLGTDLFQLYMPIYGHKLGLSATAIGGILATFAAASFVVRMAMPRLLLGLREETLLAYAFYLAAIGLALIPLVSNPLLLAIPACMFGLGMGVGQPLTLMLTLSRSPEGRSGETLGVRLTANSLTRVVGPLVFGAVGSALGLFAVFWINGLMMITGGRLARARAPTPGDPRR
jgi:MFS family permease